MHGSAAARRLCLLLFLAIPAAHAETNQCLVVPSLPATLDVPGHYCLEADSAQQFVGAAITITADNVVLDCNGRRIRNTFALNEAVGIAAADCNQGVIRNCVVDGFRQGINVIATSDGRGDGNRIVGNHVLNSRQLGILLSGSYNLVADNRITRVSGNYGGPLYGVFLQNYGSGAVGNVLRDNFIADFQPSPQMGQQGTTNAIFVAGARNTLIEGNTISGLYAATDAWVWAIESYGSQQVVRGNTVIAPVARSAPIDGTQQGGIMLFGNVPQDDLGNACSDNVVGGFVTDISGCVASGNSEF